MCTFFPHPLKAMLAFRYTCPCPWIRQSESSLHTGQAVWPAVWSLCTRVMSCPFKRWNSAYFYLFFLFLFLSLPLSASLWLSLHGVFVPQQPWFGSLQSSREQCLWEWEAGRSSGSTFCPLPQGSTAITLCRHCFLSRDFDTSVIHHN